jgi:hypothetical protein
MVKPISRCRVAAFCFAGVSPGRPTKAGAWPVEVILLAWAEHRLEARAAALSIERQRPGVAGLDDPALGFVLRAWAERTRTRKRHFREAIEILGKFSLVRRTLWDLRPFARELQQRSSK